MSVPKPKPGPKRVYSKPELPEKKTLSQPYNPSTVPKEELYAKPIKPKRPAPPKPSRSSFPLQKVQQVTEEEYRIVLLGRTGAGKSATGNTIFGKTVFKSEIGASSITYACKMHKEIVQGYPLLIADTPGLFDTHKPNEVTKKEILKLLAVTAPGPHAIILVIPIHQRYTPEMKEASEYFQKIFGIEAQAYTMVLFTGEDNLEADDVTFEDYIAKAPPALNTLLAEVKFRYVPFNNRTTSEEKRKAQVDNLMNAIRKMVAGNGGGYYSNESFEAADKALQEHDAKLVQQLETEKERKLNAIRYPSEENPIDLGEPGSAKHKANTQKYCKSIAEEFNQKMGNVRQNVREQIIEDYPGIIVTDGWFMRVVKKVASALGFE